MLGFGALPQPPEDKNLSGGYPMDIRIGILSSVWPKFTPMKTVFGRSPRRKDVDASGGQWGRAQG